MTTKSRIFTILTVIAILTCTIIPANATENTEEYIENKETIYFENINVAVKDNEELILTTSTDANLFEKIKANQEIDILDKYFEKYEETEAAIAEQMSKGSLYALSYTESPLIYTGDHFERIKSSASNGIATGETYPSGYLTLCSLVLDTNTQNNAGDNQYLGITVGNWTGNNTFNGNTSPASGLDSVIQVMDEGFVIGDHIMGAEYKTLFDVEDGVSGTDFFPTILDLDDEFLVHYQIKDDPVGTRRLSAFTLTAEYFGAKTGTTREFYSVYVHTWREMEFDFSIMQESEAGIELGTDVIQITIGGGRTLIIDPSVEEKSWALPANVAFDF